VHDRELTYSIALPHSSPRSTTAGELYDLFHETLVQTFATFGVAAAMYRPDNNACEVGMAPKAAAEPFLCFQRRSCGDIICGGAKIVGSAQRRRRGAVLQHGSILLARSAAAPELPGVTEVAAVGITPAELTERWLPTLATRLGAQANLGKLTRSEHEQARQFALQRYSASDFLHRR
jgi:lipoate-protein ligase A